MNRLESLERRDVLRDEIAHTRAELGETVQALAARADVPARARASAHRTADKMRAAGAEPRPWLLLAAGAGAVVLLAVLLRGRRR